jgi:hypothetical protein
MALLAPCQHCWKSVDTSNEPHIELKNQDSQMCGVVHWWCASEYFAPKQQLPESHAIDSGGKCVAINGYRDSESVDAKFKQAEKRIMPGDRVMNKRRQYRGQVKKMYQDSVSEAGVRAFVRTFPTGHDDDVDLSELERVL